jgi:hypothetical protein
MERHPFITAVEAEAARHVRYDTSDRDDMIAYYTLGYLKSTIKDLADRYPEVNKHLNDLVESINNV